MSGLEVVSAVAAVVSAFHGAAELVTHLKKKRRRRSKSQQGFEERQLYDSLYTGELQVTKRYDGDCNELGESMRVGDAHACARLLHVVCVMQAEVIKSLQIAVRNENAVLNLRMLHEASIVNRKDSIAALDELKHRILSTSHAAPSRALTASGVGANHNSNYAMEPMHSHRTLDETLVPDDYIPLGVTIPEPGDSRGPNSALARIFSHRRTSSGPSTFSQQQSIAPREDPSFTSPFLEHIFQRSDNGQANMRDINDVIGLLQSTQSMHQGRGWAAEHKNHTKRDTWAILNGGDYSKRDTMGLNREALELLRKLPPTPEEVPQSPQYPAYHQNDFDQHSQQQSQSQHPQQQYEKRQYAHQQYPQQHHPQKQHQQQYHPQQRLPQQHHPQQHLPQQHLPQQHLPQQHLPQQQSPCSTTQQQPAAPVESRWSAWSTQSSTRSDAVTPSPYADSLPSSSPPTSTTATRPHDNLYQQHSPPLQNPGPYFPPRSSSRSPHHLTGENLASPPTMPSTTHAPTFEVASQPYGLPNHGQSQSSLNRTFWNRQSCLEYIPTRPAPPPPPKPVPDAPIQKPASITSSSSSSSTTTIKAISPIRSTKISTGTIQGPSIPQTSSYPCKENNYWGFCKGAWAMREDVQRGLGLQTLPVGMTGKKQVWTCKHCHFTGAVCSAPASQPSKTGKKGKRGLPMVDPRIYVSALGIRYRWIFLAKSHVKKKTIDGSQTTPLATASSGAGAMASRRGGGGGGGARDEKDECNFGCVVCSVEGTVTGIFGNVETLMNHVWLEHVQDGGSASGDGHGSGAPSSEKIWQKSRCIVGRVAGIDEDWDLNIPDLKVVVD